MEGDFESQPDGAPLILFGWPEHGRRRRIDYAIEIPKLGSLILNHELERAAARASTACRARTGRRSPLVFWSLPHHGRHRLR